MSAVVLPAALLAGCGKANMSDQAKDQTWDRNSFFANGTVMRDAPPGTVAHGTPGAAVPQPARIDAAMLDRGQQQFDINCTPCHGLSGDGLGMIVQRGFPRPPPLYGDKLIAAKASDLYDVITNGHGKMYSYADRVAPADRWAIIAYIRALQMGTAAPAALLDKQDLAALAQPGGGS